MTIEEAAQVLGISEPMAKRHWAYARAWLYEEIRSQQGRARTVERREAFGVRPACRRFFTSRDHVNDSPRGRKREQASKLPHSKG